MPVKLTQEQFINKAISIHGEEYDYSLVQYVNGNTKIKIICKVHGIFYQLPRIHIHGKCGCPGCIDTNKKRTCQKNHGVNYPQQSKELRDKRYQTMVDRYGVKHALQNKEIQSKKDQSMVDRYGVRYSQQSENLRKKSKQTKLINHGDENYTNREKAKQTKLIRYGDENYTNREKAEQTNLIRHGDSCYNNREKYKFNHAEVFGVNHPNQRHMASVLPYIEDRSWLLEQYITSKKTALQISTELGINDGTVGRYLRKANIELTQNFWKSYKCGLWLAQISRDQCVTIIPEYSMKNNRRYRADGYCRETNTIYEFWGDYWHGNPQVYSSDHINAVNGKSMGELFEETTKKIEWIISNGFQLVELWENDFNKTVDFPI